METSTFAMRSSAVLIAGTGSSSTPISRMNCVGVTVRALAVTMR